MNGRLVPAAPGAEAEVIGSLKDAEHGVSKDAVILVGERLAADPRRPQRRRRPGRDAPAPASPGCRAAPATAVRSRPAPCPTCCPAAVRSTEAAARVDVAAAWGVDSLPAKVGRDGNAIVAALAKGDLGGLVVGGVDPDDTSDPAAFRAALDAAGFVVSLELRETDVTRVADVVLPVAPVTDKAGTFVTWDGRARVLRRGLHQPRLAARPARPVRHRRRARRSGTAPARLPHGRRGPRRDAGPRPVGRRPSRRSTPARRRSRPRPEGQGEAPSPWPPGSS